MSLVDVDSWSTEYEACDRLNHSLLAQLVQREKRQRLSPEYNRLTAAIQVGLNQYETELRQLKSKLNASAKGRTITFEEIERRQRQVDILQSQLQQLQTKYTNTTRSDRSSLLDQQPTGLQSQWQTSRVESDDNETESLKKPVDVEALKQTQIDILEEQNRGLETLSQTISRQRTLATQLGQEVEDQNDILDNLANTMERVDTGVNIETTNIGQINRRDTTWGYWVVIVILLIVDIIVALM